MLTSEAQATPDAATAPALAAPGRYVHDRCFDAPAASAGSNTQIVLCMPSYAFAIEYMTTVLRDIAWLWAKHPARKAARRSCIAQYSAVEFRSAVTTGRHCHDVLHNGRWPIGLASSKANPRRRYGPAA